MFRSTFFLAIGALFFASVAFAQLDDIFRGPCGGRGRAASTCRAMADEGTNCQVVACQRGTRRGFRCTCRPEEVIEEMDRQADIFRGPCGGRGRAASTCRAMDDEENNCQVVACQRGTRRGFRCTCRPAEVVEEVIEETDRQTDDIFRGPCGGRGRAARTCREMADDESSCQVVACQRGTRTGFRCTCRPN